MSVVRKNLVLNFKAEDDTKLQIKVLKPKEGLTPTQIKEAMNTIIEEGAIGEESTVSSIMGAQYDIRDVEDIVLE